jgi:hypothetical protein
MIILKTNVYGKSSGEPWEFPIPNIQFPVNDKFPIIKFLLLNFIGIGYWDLIRN